MPPDARPRRPRDAGASAAREAVRRRRRTAARRLAVLALAGAIVATVIDRGRQPPLGPLAAVAVAGVAALAWPSRGGRWAAGAAGERATARTLAGLDADGWSVLHDVRLPGRRWNIDHVLVGPPGVVVVETKQWRRPVRTLRRHPKVLEERVGWQVEAVERALGDDVQAVIRPFLCVHGAPVRRLRRSTAVGNGRHLRRWLRRLPRQLGPREVRKVADHLHGTFVPG